MHPVFVPEERLAAHLEEVEQRWRELRASDVLSERAESVNRAVDHAAFERMFAAASGARSGGQRVVWLHRAADVIARGVTQAQASPCQKGCSHCCHTPVLLSRAEATYLSTVSSRKMVQTPHNAVNAEKELQRETGPANTLDGAADRWKHHTGQPCPFLKESACSVWSARPLACRFYYSLDADNLLCRLLPEHRPVEVPQLNVLLFTAMAWGVLGLRQDAADIRDWFAEVA